MDPTNDTGADTAVNTGVDTAADTAVNTGVDTAADTAADTGGNTGVDTAADTAVDTGGNTGDDFSQQFVDALNEYRASSGNCGENSLALNPEIVPVAADCSNEMSQIQAYGCTPTADRLTANGVPMSAWAEAYAQGGDVASIMAQLKGNQSISDSLLNCQFDEVGFAAVPDANVTYWATVFLRESP